MLPLMKLSTLGPAILLGLVLLPVIVVIRRLFLSPISRIPGPKLAAITGWVGTYYDVFAGGQFTFKIRDWHEKYGSIIRISPDEIHIADPDFFEIAYAPTASFDKLKSWNHRLGVPDAVNSTTEHDLHRLRKSALVSSMTRKQALAFAPHIQQQADVLCNRLLREYKGTAKAVNLDDAFAALTTDMIFQYTFGWNYEFLRCTGFVAPFTKATQSWALSVHAMQHFPWLQKLSVSLPDWFVTWVNPDFKDVIKYRRDIRNQILKSQSGEMAPTKETELQTVFETLMASRLPVSEKTLDRLSQELTGVVGAAIEATKKVLAAATFHVLSEPAILRTLRTELAEAEALNSGSALSFVQLEKLPYLTAVLKEALRIGHGVAQRLPRVSKHPVQCGDFTIPAGTAFSMSIFQQHQSAVFADHKSFKPERWLDKPRARSAPGKEEKPLERFFVPFSKGTRNCIGQHIAWVELYVVFATLIKRVDMRLFETTLRDVEMGREYFTALIPADANGLRVTVE